MKITIEFIPHEQHRYPTVGDWFYEPNGEDLVIRVSKLSNHRFEALVAVHELVEVLLCKEHVSQQAVDHFDMEFEKLRQLKIESCVNNADHEGAVLAEIAEPGDQKDAPYRTEHCIATGVERILAGVMGVCWADYETELESLP